MFPIRDHNPSSTTPYVTYGLIALNFAIYLLQLSLSGDPQAMGAFVRAWALFPAEVTQSGVHRGLLTHMFLHAGFMHVAGNMLFLWIFGDNLEDQMGHLGYLAFYLGCGLAAAIAQIASDPYSTLPMVGASGAIAGVMGGYLLLFPRARVDILFIFVVFWKVFSIPAFLMLGVWFAIQVFNGLAVQAGTGGVAYMAHAGGFAAGLLMTFPVWMRRGARSWWQANQGLPPNPEITYSPSTIPTIRRRK